MCLKIVSATAQQKIVWLCYNQCKLNCDRHSSKNLVLEYSNDRPIWEQQEGEPSLWYGRLELHLKQGKGRSLLGSVNVEKSKKQQKKAKTTPRSWTDASIKWEWDRRATAFDEWQSKKDWTEYQQRRSQRLKEWQEEQWNLADDLMDRVRQMLKFPLVTKRVTDEGTTILNPVKWTMKDVATFASTASKLRRESMGISDRPMDVLEAIQTLVDAGIADPEHARLMQETFEGLEQQLRNSTNLSQIKDEEKD